MENNKSFKGLSKLVWIPMGIILCVQEGNAGAKKNTPPPSCEIPGGAVVTTPTPFRKVIIDPVETTVFPLPNGGTADMGIDLKNIFRTVVANSPAFLPLDTEEPNPCQTTLRIHPAVTTFQLNIVEAGVSVGYNPTGTVGPISNITGKVNVRIGTIAMDFTVRECRQGRCTDYAGSTADQLTAHVDLNMEIDFGTIMTAPSLIYNTPLGNALRKIMEQGVADLAQAQKLPALSWSAKVVDVNPAVGLVTFDAGVKGGIGPNQAFEIYAPTDGSSTGSCNAFQTVALVHTTSVNTLSSTALIDQMMDNRGVKVGDVVIIHKILQ